MSSQFISNPEESKEFLPRYRLFYGAIAFTFLTFVFRLWFLQIIEGSELREFSEKNRLKQNKVLAPRGLVLDREGKILVENHPGFEAILNPQYIEDIEEVAEEIGPILGIETDKIVQKVTRSQRQNGPFQTVKIKDNLSRDEVFRLKRILLETPGLDIRETVVRFYPLGKNSAQLFGYVGEISKRQIPLYNGIYKGLSFEQGDIVGKNGLEEVLEKDVRGSDGIIFQQVDAFGRETFTQASNVYSEQIKDVEPTPGKNIVLTIDRDIQEAAYKSFETQQRTGAVLAMKANGEILAWVSNPSFDPNEFSQGISTSLWSTLVNDPLKPLRNKVVQDHYSPGSTFKPFMALAALQEKVIAPDTIVNCPGQLRFGNRYYHDSKKEGHGNITVYEAIERSSNIFFYKMGIALGIEKMYNYISLLGIGTKTGVEAPRETSGLMPNSAWKKQAMGEEWQPGENLSNAIGQGFVQTTPIQMAAAYNAIGLEGKLYQPFVIQKIVDLEGKTLKENSPKLVRDLTQVQPNGVHIDVATFKVVKEAMRRVANGDRGTAKFLKIPGVQMAGKTGTSQVMGFSADQIYVHCETRPFHQRHHGWFVAWAPAEQPEVVVAALAEHACHGNTGAGPVVRDVVRAYFEKYHPDIIAKGIEDQKHGIKPIKKAAEAIEGDE